MNIQSSDEMLGLILILAIAFFVGTLYYVNTFFDPMDGIENEDDTSKIEDDIDDDLF